MWSGNPRKEFPNANRIDVQRSVTFDRLAPLLDVAACEFYSLQKGEDAVRQLRDSPLRRAGNRLDRRICMTFPTPPH